MSKCAQVLTSLLVSGAFLAFGTLVVPTIAFAATPAQGIFSQACNASSDEANTQSAACADQQTTDPLTGPNGTLGKVTRDVALFAGVTAVIIMIIGGFMYILSGGDSGKVSTAKDTILYAAVGLVVIAIAQTIIEFVIDRI